MKKFISVLLPVLLLYVSASGNNIQISNISTSQVSGNVVIKFDLSWENSWRAASTGNWDGAWVFFKFKDNDGQWKPIRFTGSNITAPAGYTVDVSSNVGVDGVGAFIYRSSNGFGTVNLTNVRAGIESLPGTFDVKGFAVEMVYIPQGSFYVGDSTGIAGKAYQAANTVKPYLVYGNGSTVLLGSGAGRLSGETEQGLATDLTGFPTGFSAYWIMKYELSKGAWRDFLNCLTYNQQISRFPPGRLPNSAAGTSVILASGVHRESIRIITSGVPNSVPAVVGCDYDDDFVYNEPTDGEWKAMNHISWPDAAAWLDWAGLRPMTELEYEKACRGQLGAVPDEYAWGTADVASVTYTVINEGQVNETVSNASSTAGNAALYITYSPELRGGAFANAFSTRQSSGAGYYGAMELTGNVTEYCATTWNRAGRSYTGKQGNGILNADGDADENYWPGINGNNDSTIANYQYTLSGVTGYAGINTRGASYAASTGVRNKISFRQWPLNYITKSQAWGIRGVRDAN